MSFVKSLPEIIIILLWKKQSLLSCKKKGNDAMAKRKNQPLIDSDSGSNNDSGSDLDSVSLCSSITGINNRTEIVTGIHEIGKEKEENCRSKW